MNISPLQTLGVLVGGAAVIGGGTKLALDAADRHEAKNPGAPDTGQIARSVLVAAAGGAFMLNAVASRYGVTNLTSAATGAAIIGILGGHAFSSKA